MEVIATHPDRSLQEFVARTIVKMAHIIAHWVEQTAPERLNWVPGDPGVTKARTILDQMSELVNINYSRSAALRGEPKPAKVQVTSAEETRRELLASSQSLSDAILALPAAKLSEEVDSFLGRMPLLDLLEVLVIWNMSYHGGVINAYQLMYGDDEFSLPIPGPDSP